MTMNKWIPQKRQAEVLKNGCFETLIGGARGGGKTEVGIVWCIQQYLDNPNFRALVVRKTFTDMDYWIDRARNHYLVYGAKLRYGNEFIFPSGAKVIVGHLADKKSLEKYQGHEYQRLLIEELTQLADEKIYNRLLASCRSSDPTMKPRVLCSTNPGGSGHFWVYSRFVAPAPPNTKFKPEEESRSRIFMPMRLEDNPALMEADPSYVSYLDGLKKSDPALYKAWRLGDWSSFEGQYFREFRTDIHTCQPFKIPEDQIRRRVIGLDYGYTAPSAALWIALMNDGRAIVYRELYETKLTYKDLARRIMQLTPENERRNMSVMADPSIIEKRGDHSHSSGKEQMYEAGLKMRLVGAKNSRIDGWQVVRNFLQIKSDPNTGEEYARLQIFDTCRNLIRTLPQMVHDDRNPEDLDTNGEDHCNDALRYGLVDLNGGFTDKKLLTKINTGLERSDTNPLTKVY